MKLDNLLQEFRKPFKERKDTGLEKVKYLADLLDNPQNSFFSIHISGTNGKGSVGSMLNQSLTELDLKVGLFTSPHLERFTERIKVNNQEISENDFIRILNNHVLPLIEKIDQGKYDLPTEFEVISLVAFYYFREQNVDIAVIECGLGGRFDATNILENVVLSIITSISQDHTDRLGESIKEITYHKVGIIKPFTYVISSEMNIEKELFYQESQKVNNGDLSYLYFAEPKNLESLDLNFNNQEKVKRCYTSKDKSSIYYNKNIESNFIADYQKENIAIVLKALEFFYKQKDKLNKIKNIDKNQYLDKTIKGLEKAVWNGRFEIFKFNDLNIILDGAHNDNGMKAFTDSLKELPLKKIITIFACNKDKDYKNMINYLSDISETIIVTKSHVEIKAKDPENISQYLKTLNKDHKIVKDYRQTIDFACKIITKRNYDKKDVLICVCGSLYLIGAIREQINSLNF